MEAEEILTRIKTGEDVPDDWVILPLLRKKVLLGIVGWVVGILMALALLVLVVSVVIPYNYQHGVGTGIFTTILLGVLLFVAIGSFSLLISDIRRVRQAEKHVMVITDEIFVKQEGKKTIAVPLIHIHHVTPRGRVPVEPVTETPPAPGSSLVGGLFGGGRSASSRRRGMRSPTSLAFMDVRTQREITVVNDGSYGDPFKIAALLKEYVRSASSPAQIAQETDQ